MSASNHLHKLGEYSKAVTGVVVSFGATLGLLSEFLTDVSGGDFGLAGVVSVVTGVSVWFVKNQDRIDQAGDIAGDMYPR